MKRKERCEACRFWERTSKGELYPFEGPPDTDEDTGEPLIGQCQRHPPTLVGLLVDRCLKLPLYANNHATHNASTVIRHASRWPVTWIDDWCGEWKPKSAELDTP